MRTITPAFRDNLEATDAQDIIIIFATITHPSLSVPITVNSDIADYIYNGSTYFGTGVSLTLITDDDTAPTAKVTLQNVDRQIGEALLLISEAPQIQLELIKRSDFDFSDPRMPVGTPIVEYFSPLMFLRNVQWDAQQITADLVSYDLTTEPWPKIRTTPAVTPALFR